MSIVDSSGWIEYFVGGPNQLEFAPAIEGTDGLVVPTIVVTEVSRWLRAHGLANAEGELTALMTRGTVALLDLPTAVLAGALGIAHKLPLADSIIYATGQRHGHDVWTQDADFEGLAGVRYFPKRR